MFYDVDYWDFYVTFGPEHLHVLFIRKGAAKRIVNLVGEVFWINVALQPRSWVCFDWSEVTSDDQSKHRYGKLTLSVVCMQCPHTCVLYSMHLSVLACNVVVEFDCVE